MACGCNQNTCEECKARNQCNQSLVCDIELRRNSDGIGLVLVNGRGYKITRDQNGRILQVVGPGTDVIHFNYLDGLITRILLHE